MLIRDRIQDFRRVSASTLLPNPKNWRVHNDRQRNILRGILAEIGYADALLVRELPDGSLQLIDGHLRAETTPEQQVPVLVLDLNEDEADKLLATLDPLAALAETNQAALDNLLVTIETENVAIQEFLHGMADSPVAEDGADNEVSVPEVFQVLVTCQDEEEQKTVYELLTDNGYQPRIVSL